MPLSDPIFVGLLIAMLVFAVFMYLFVRRTVTQFREGFEGGRR